MRKEPTLRRSARTLSWNACEEASDDEDIDLPTLVIAARRRRRARRSRLPRRLGDRCYQAIGAAAVWQFLRQTFR